MKTTAYTLRGNRIDKWVHYYRKSQLADPSVHELVPWCQIDADPQKVHERADVDLSGVARYQLCPGCHDGRTWVVTPPAE